MERAKGISLHDKPVNTEYGDLDSVDILEDDESRNMTKDVTDVNQMDSSANQNSFPTVPLKTDLATCSTSENKEDYSSSKPKTEKPKKIIPNYFIAIRIYNRHIRNGVKNCQDSVVMHQKELKRALNPLATLHLTLLVVHLENEEQIQKATEILHQCRSILEKEPILQNGTLTLNFKGLGNFEHNVLFVKPCGREENERLNKLANIVRETFAEKGIRSTDSREFKPHLTIIDLKRSPELRKKGINKIPVEWYSMWADLKFGEERVTGLHLCSMEEKDKDDFFKCEASVKFGADNKASA